MTVSDVDSAAFRDAMSRFASGVTIVTTTGPDGAPAGFTASAFSSLSLEPPLLLVCLDRGADCFDSFSDTGTMAVSILASGQDDIAMRFATRGADKFGPGGTSPGPANGDPVVDGALAFAECTIEHRYDGGDHVIIVGRVRNAESTDTPPLLHYQRQFGVFKA